jgi:hypothetical protein
LTSSTSAPDTPAPAPAPPRAALWARLSIGWKIFGAFVFLAGVPSTFYGLYALFHHPHPAAAIEELAIGPHPSRNVRLGAFLDTHPGFGAGRSLTGKRDVVGDVFTLDFRLIGLGGKTVALRWFPIAAGSDQQPLPWPRWAPRTITLKPKGDDFPVHQDVWVPTPNGSSGAFIERFQAAAPGGVVRDVDAPQLSWFNP